MKYRIGKLARDRVEHSEGSDGVVRITNRLFPECERHTPIADSFDWRRFHLRFYLPVRPFLDRKPRRIKRVFVLINGLNEINWYTQYDQIGSFLARNRIAAVLLPTPDHLIRHPRFRYDNPTEQHESERPLKLLEETPSRLYERFKQYMGEIETLVTHLRGARCGNRDCAFYDIFSDDVQVSVLGYSLGGLAALSFLLHRPNLVNACVLLNSGASLENIKLPPKMIDPTKWEELVATIKRSWLRPDDTYDLASLFEHVFLGLDGDALRTALSGLVGRRVLLVAGGADAVVPLSGIAAIEPTDRGLHLLKIPGLSHFLGKDSQWDQWLEIALTHIVRFAVEAEGGVDRWSTDEIVERLAEFHRRFAICNGDGIDARAVVDDEEFRRVEFLLRTARCLFESERLLAEAVLRKAEARTAAAPNL